MWCFQAKRWISAYLDDELDGAKRSALEEHLGRCRECTAELDRLRSHWIALRAVDDVPPLPSELWSLIEQGLDDAEERPWYRRRREIAIRAAAVAVAVALGLATGALVSWNTRLVHGDQQAPPESEERMSAEAFDTPVFALGGEEGWSRCELD